MKPEDVLKLEGGDWMICDGGTNRDTGQGQLFPGMFYGCSDDGGLVIASVLYDQNDKTKEAIRVFQAEDVTPATLKGPKGNGMVHTIGGSDA